MAGKKKEDCKTAKGWGGRRAGSGKKAGPVQSEILHLWMRKKITDWIHRQRGSMAVGRFLELLLMPIIKDDLKPTDGSYVPPPPDVLPQDESSDESGYE